MDFFKELLSIFVKLKQTLPPILLTSFQYCSYDALHAYHFGLGTYLRNEILTEESLLYGYLILGGLCQKDDMSRLLIQLFYIYLNQKQGIFIDKV